MRLKKLVPMVGFCAVSCFSSSVIAQLWVKNCATNQCLDATTADPNGKVQVSECNTNLKAQEWYANRGLLPSPISNAYFEQQCLDMHEAVVGGFEAVTNPCDDTKHAQNWHFVPNGYDGPIENGYYSGQCLTVANDGAVTPAGCNGERSQRWYWVNVGDDIICPQTATGEGRMKLPKQTQPVPRMKLPKQTQPVPRMKLSTQAQPVMNMADFKPICSFNSPGSCTRDINECGHPSVCQCPVTYTYNPATGKCDYTFKKLQTSGADSCKKPDCSINPKSACTLDRNECGNPSFCVCPKGYEYNPATKKCDIDL